MNIKCTICEKDTKSILTSTRSKTKIYLNKCSHCDFLFAAEDKTNSLKNNNLDKTRLKDAGMSIPALNEDFKNGSIQADKYFNEYIKEKKQIDILEIGCSWGYFLNICKTKGNNVTGVEINEIRKEYVQNKLKINCFSDIDALLEKKIKFDKIFLFYVLEYINEPLSYIEKLLTLIKDKGEIIIHTPNTNDSLINIWANKSYKDFTIDEHVINYFSIKSFEVISSIFSKKEFSIINKQYYSLFNHLKWFFTNKPSTTGIVGGDNFTDDIINEIKNSEGKSSKDILLSKKIIDFIKSIDQDYKKIIEENDLGNNIIIKIQNKY